MKTDFYQNENSIYCIEDYYNSIRNALFDIKCFEDAKFIIKENYSDSILSEKDFYICKHKFGFIIIFQLEDLDYMKTIYSKLCSLNLKVNSLHYNYFSVLIWEDYEEEVNYLDCKILFNLFKDIKAFKNLILKELTLNDIYFSKIHKKFYIKNFSKFILVDNLDISFTQLSYNPKFILNGIAPHIYINKKFDYESAQKYQVSYNSYNNSFGGF